MKNIIVVQARMGSSRLPCKTLLCLRGWPVIEWIIRRCYRSVLVDELVLAIPDTEQDDVLADHVQHMGVRVHRGSESDVLRRMHGAAVACNAEGDDRIVRVCADNPLIWGPEIDNLLRYFAVAGVEYAYNHIPKNNRYPDGLGAEVVSFATFEAVEQAATDARHREHCLSYICDQPEKFSIGTFDPPDVRLQRPDLKLDMDTMDDFVHLARLPLHPNMTPLEIIALFDGRGKVEK